MSSFSLVCSSCSAVYSPDEAHGLCACGRPLLCIYPDDHLRGLDRDRYDAARPMWNWREVMPLPLDEEPVTLGEGGTPLVAATRLAEAIGSPKLRLQVKDEAMNPTGSFKARGLSAAVTMARHFGQNRIVIPTAGNAGSALAAYCAHAGLTARILAPRDVPENNLAEMRLFGAEVTLIDGLIDDCGREARRLVEDEGWFDVSTLKEPYRLEGKKTLGYELAAANAWALPDVIVYPTGGGTGLVGMWKAFDEMRRAGWLDDDRMPKMVSVQAAGCAPIVRAFHDEAEAATRWDDAETYAAGLRVPAAVGDKLMLKALRESHGTAIAIDDDTMRATAGPASEASGVHFCPEGAACVAAVVKLREEEFIAPGDRVVVFNTATGLKY